jgi:hypothetical protein
MFDSARSGLVFLALVRLAVLAAAWLVLPAVFVLEALLAPNERAKLAARAGLP